MTSSPAVTVITARGGARLLQFFADLWHYRDLFVSFLERDVKLRYKQTAFGVVWVVAQPLITTGLFALIFGRVVGVDTGGLSPGLFYLSAMVPWIAFTQALSNSAASLEINAGLISKIYFPRIVVPGASIFATLPDFAIGFGMLNIAALYAGHWNWLLLALMPGLLLMQMATAAGVGLFLTALNAQYRDVKYVIPFIIQLGLFLTPIIVPMAKLMENRPWVEYCQWFNPMAGVVTTYRWTLGGAAPSFELLLANALCALAYLIGGLLFFRWREAKLVDVI
jgi:lipopolysaccharide transport system permease protein